MISYLPLIITIIWRFNKVHFIFFFHQIIYCQTNALNCINFRVIKNTLKMQKLLQHVSVQAGTIIREPESVLS